MSNIKVFNPHPRLVNVALEGGKFIRILPRSEAEVDPERVKRLLAAGELVKSGDRVVEEPDDTDDEQTVDQTEKPVKATKRKRR